MSAILPATLLGKSDVLPTPQKTNPLLIVGRVKQIESPREFEADMSSTAYSWPSLVVTESLTKVERTSTPGATTFRSTPRCENDATVPLLSIAPTEKMPG